MNTLIRCCVAGLTLWVTARSQDRHLEQVLQHGEELTYSVRWMFIRLGTVVIRTERVEDGFKVVMIVESNPSLPFADIEEYNECLIQRGSVTTSEFHGVWRSGQEKSEIRMKYDETAGKLTYMEKDLKNGMVIVSDTLSNVPPFVNGPSLFVLTRWSSQSARKIHVPTIVGGRVENTILDFTCQDGDIDVAGVGYPIRCRKYMGQAEWKGGTAAGLSGEFTGWISDDDAAVIMRANMKVLLGSITIELEKWHRAGWTPPTEPDIVKK